MMNMRAPGEARTSRTKLVSVVSGIGAILTIVLPMMGVELPAQDKIDNIAYFLGMLCLYFLRDAMPPRQDR